MQGRREVVHCRRVADHEHAGNATPILLPNANDNLARTPPKQDQIHNPDRQRNHQIAARDLKLEEHGDDGDAAEGQTIRQSFSDNVGNLVNNALPGLERIKAMTFTKAQEAVGGPIGASVTEWVWSLLHIGAAAV